MGAVIGRIRRFVRQHPRAAQAVALGLAVMRTQSVERISLSAAAVAFWAAIAVTPAFIAIAIVFGRLLDPQALDESVKALQATAPDSLGSLLATQLKSASTATTSSLSWGLALSLVTVLWAVSTSIYTFQRAVRIAYGMDPQRYVSARAWAYLGSVILIAILGVLLLAAGGGAAWASTLDEPWRALAFAVGIAVALLVGTGLLTAAFRLTTEGQSQHVNWPGAAFGAVGSFAVVIGFGVYLRFATSYQAIYGTLASTVILSIVIYVAAYVILIGAISNAALGQLLRDGANDPSGAGQSEAARESNSPA